MQIKKLITLLIGLFSVVSYAQLKPIHGQIVIENLEGDFDYTNVKISNQMRQKMVYSNEKGQFLIEAQVGDVLEFSNFLTDLRTLKISENLYQKGFVTIHLDLEIIQLNEADLTRLKPNFKDNIKSNNSSQSEMLKSLGLNPNLQDIEVNPNMTSTINTNGVLDPSFWISSITGQRKKDKKTDAFFKSEKTLDKIKLFFTEDYFIDDLKIPQYHVNAFMQYSAQNANIRKLFEQNKIDEMILRFEELAPNYLKLIAN